MFFFGLFHLSEHSYSYNTKTNATNWLICVGEEQMRDGKGRGVLVDGDGGY